MGVGGQCHALATLSLENRPRTHLIWGWVGPRTGLDGHRKSNRHLDSIPRAIQPVASHSTVYAILHISKSKNVKLKNTELEHK
jgi:hypothetical protein